MVVAGEMAARHPALRRARLLVDRVRRRQRARVLRDPVHRSVSARAVRLQRRRAALDLAGDLLHLRRARHRPVPAVHPCRGRRLPGPPRDRLPDAPVARAGAGQVVAARDTALPHRRHLRRWRHLDAVARDRHRRWRARADRSVGVHRRDRPGVHRALPAADLRLRPGHEPLGDPGRCLCRADDRPVPAVPPRPRWTRTRRHDDGADQADLPRRSGGAGRTAGCCGAAAPPGLDCGPHRLAGDRFGVRGGLAGDPRGRRGRHLGDDLAARLGGLSDHRAAHLPDDHLRGHQRRHRPRRLDRSGHPRGRARHGACPGDAHRPVPSGVRRHRAARAGGRLPGRCRPPRGHGLGRRPRPDGVRIGRGRAGSARHRRHLVGRDDRCAAPSH